MYRESAKTPAEPPPKADVVIDSPLSPTRLMDAIAEEVVDWRSSLREQLAGDHDFSGWLEHDALRIKRVQWYQNSFAPIFRGRIEARGRGSRLVGSFDLNRAVVVLMYVMAGMGVLFVAVAVLLLVFEDPEPSVVGVLLVGLAMAVLMPQARKLQFPPSDRDEIEAMLRRAAQPKSVGHEEPPARDGR